MSCGPVPCTDTTPGPSILDQIAETLGEQGWCVTPGFVSPLLVGELRREALDLYAQGEFRHAGVSRGENLRIRPEVRTDRVHWMDPAQCGGAQRFYLDTLEALRQSLNRALFLGLFEYEGHLAVYPPGSYYRKHLDQFLGMGLRTVTAILYLNPDWTEDDGGALRIYCDPQDPDHYEDVPPLGGQLVTFLSARYLHEVLPSRRDRLSATGWFSRRDAAPF